MPRTMTLPKIGVNMTEAVIDEWFVKPGDTVSEGDAIFLAETDKATQDIYATESGVVGKLLAEQGDKVEIHQPIMILLDEGEEYTEDTAETVPEAKEEKTTEEAAAKPAAPAVTAVRQTGDRIRISPLARKLAKEKGIDIAALKPAAPGKRIVKADVLAYTPAAAPAAAAAPSRALGIPDDDVLETIPLSGTRKVIAARMSESNLEKPCAALTLTARADAVIALRERLKARGMQVSYNDILVCVAAKALAIHRDVNAVLDGDEIKRLKSINVGVAVDSERGLLVPVIRNADQKSLMEIAGDFAAKVEAIRENRIGADDLTDGTFTITNLGMFEIEQFVPVINPPECAILAVGAMKREFVPDEEDRPIVVTNMKMTLVFDHRIVDGAPAAKFLQRVKSCVECAELLL